jgi:hypothetical protein
MAEIRPGHALALRMSVVAGFRKTELAACDRAAAWNSDHG